MNSPDVVSVVTEDPGEADLSQLGQLTGPKSCWILVPEPACVRKYKSCDSITEYYNRYNQNSHTSQNYSNKFQSQEVCISVKDQFCIVK